MSRKKISQELSAVLTDRIKAPRPPRVRLTRGGGPGPAPGKPNAGKFQPGNKIAVGNPGNSPPVRARRFITNALVAALLKDRDAEETALEGIVKKLLATAETGSETGAIAAAREIMDRVEGKPTQSVELTGSDKGPIKTITGEMTPAEAARLFQQTLEDEGE